MFYLYLIEIIPLPSGVQIHMNPPFIVQNICVVALTNTEEC